ncbi:MAG: class I SAM-dependent methyltransferase [Phycisphaerae bacterium]|nr:class I SAM-dependent methyltransferase [Phycisphaerae bacterium]MDD5381678.1 class I SAM-dependent methyltransferase [Phycisphaerae bacterium]
MKILKTLKIKIYNIIRLYRWKTVRKLLDPNAKNLLDIGCSELFFYDKLKDKYDVTAADSHPTSELIKKEDIQNLSFPDKSFDIVICQQVLEHVFDPVKAIYELRRVTRKQLIISVPYEPFFTLCRCLVWEKNHLWAITPKALKFHLGKPTYEKKLCLKRYYIAVWNCE